MALILIGALSLGLAAAVWVFVRDQPTDLGWPPISSRSSKESPTIPLSQGLRQVLIYVPFWIIAVWFFFGGAVSFSFVGLWGGPYLQHVHGLSKGQAGHVLSLFSIGVIVGSAFLSFASNRLVRARKAIVVGASGFNLCLTAALVVFISNIPLVALYFVCFGFGCVTSALVVVGYTVAKELFPIQLAGTATGFVNLFPFAGGAVFQPVLGYILERYGVLEGAFTLAGYRAAFLTLVGCAAVGLLAVTRLKEAVPSESHQTS
jgi:sugar phosphate permease